MVVRTIASFVAYKADAGGDGVPLIARGAPGTAYLAAENGQRTENAVSTYDIKTGGLVQASSNIHGVVEGFAVDAPDSSPGVYYVSGSLETEMQRFIEGSRGGPGLPGVNAIPADEAVGEYLSISGSATNSEAKQLVRGVLTNELNSRTADVLSEEGAARSAVESVVSDAVDVSPRLSQPHDPTAFIDNLRIVAMFPQYASDTDNAFMQGFSINKADNELYLSFAGGSYGWQRFEVRDLTTGERKAYRQMPCEPRAFTEGIPWFKNGFGQLCLIVRLKSPFSPGPGNTYQILNFEKNTLGPVINIEGYIRGDVYGDYYVTTDAGGGARVTKFWVYDWQSVKDGAPDLLSTTLVSNPGKTAAKMQGMAVLGGTYYLYGGTAEQAPTVTAYDASGQLLIIRRWTRKSFREAMNNEQPDAIRNVNFEWEAEGATNLDGRIVTGHVVGTDDDAGLFKRYVVLVQHGDPVGSKMVSEPILDYQRDTDWVAVEYAPGFQAATALRPLEYRVKDGQVFWRGTVQTDPSGIFPESTPYISKDVLPEEATPTKAQRFWIGESETDGYAIFERERQLRVSIKSSTGAYVEFGGPTFLNT